MSSHSDPSSRFDRSPLASDNERLILDIVRRCEPIARSAITGHTNLTQQSVHRLVEGLVERGLLRAGAAMRGSRGQPSPTIELVDEAVCAVGISINTDFALLCLVDFGCNPIAQVRLPLVPQDRAATLRQVAIRLDQLLAERDIARTRLLGLGFSMAGFFVSADRAFNAPEPLRDWSLIDLRPIIEDTFRLPVWLENNANTAAIGESLRGVGLWCPTFAYLSFNYGFGGGLILDGKPYLGVFGNAAEFSGIYTPEEAPRRPALQYLLRRLQAEGVAVQTVEDLQARFDPTWPGLDAWLDEVMPQVDRLVASLIAVVDPQAIVFGGQLPHALGQRMIDRVQMPSGRPHRYGIGPPEARLVLSEAKGDASAIGAALLPLKLRYFL